MRKGVNSAIHYFKTIDNNDLIQSEYNDLETPNDNCSYNLPDVSLNTTNVEADKLLMRSIKNDIYTLDKYVTKTIIKKNDETIMPKQKEINLKDEKLKIKGLKKKNIVNLYEDNDTKNKIEASTNKKNEK